MTTLHETDRHTRIIDIPASEVDNPAALADELRKAYEAGKDDVEFRQLMLEEALGSAGIKGADADTTVYDRVLELGIDGEDSGTPPSREGQRFRITFNNDRGVTDAMVVSSPAVDRGQERRDRSTSKNMAWGPFKSWLGHSGIRSTGSAGEGARDISKNAGSR